MFSMCSRYYGRQGSRSGLWWNNGRKRERYYAPRALERHDHPTSRIILTWRSSEETLACEGHRGRSWGVGVEDVFVAESQGSGLYGDGGGGMQNGAAQEIGRVDRSMYASGLCLLYCIQCSEMSIILCTGMSVILCTGMSIILCTGRHT